MGAASKGGIICAKCGLGRRKFQQIKGGFPVCKECYEDGSAKQNAELRRKIHELEAEVARLKREGNREDIFVLKPMVALTPPEERWDGYTH